MASKYIINCVIP